MKKEMSSLIKKKLCHNWFKIHLFHTKYTSSPLTFIDISLKSYQYKIIKHIKHKTGCSNLLDQG